MIDKVNAVLNRCATLEEEMISPDFANNLKRMEAVGREFNDLKRKLPKLNEYKTAVETIEESQEIIAENEDAELVEMAKEELAEAKASIPILEEELRTLLIPKDPTDHKNAILEIRAGAGGTEAGLFAGDLYRMYTYHCDQKGWKMEVLSSSYGEQDAIKEIIVLVKGDGVYGELKYESGVHRVQRVPKTESQGRVHTSAASVAVLPETDDVEIEIKTADLKIDVYRSSGPGGQSVNTTDSAVRITHLPTGIVSTCQDEKSQIKNKARALKILQSRIFDHILSQKQAEESAVRKSLVGTGDRSAKIRTYNFPQGRVTDHRINFSVFKLEQVLSGDLQDFTDALGQAEMKEKLESAE